MKNTEFLIIRHGQSVANAENVYLGHTDKDLSELGYRQAEACAAALSDVEVDFVYSSDLLRAQSTAEPHARLRGLEVNTSRELRELNIGLWENRKIDDIIAEWGDEFLVGWRKNFGIFTPPCGEGVRAGGERFCRELERIAKRHPGKRIIIAAHAAVIRSAWGVMAGIAPETLAEAIPFPTNASLTRVDFDGKQLIPIEYSNSSYAESAYSEA